MRVSVAQRAAVQDRGMIEQRTVSVRHSFQTLDKPGEQLDMEDVDLRDLLDKVGMAAMMRERMVRIGNADLRIRANAAFAAQHHGGDAGEIRLECDGLQIEHHLYVIPVLEGNSGGLLGGRRDGVSLGGGYTHFDLPNAGEK